MAIDAEPNVSRYLEGHYAPVRDERIDADLTVIGELPAGLVGTYMRNGGNPEFAPVGRYHLFDGDGMIHAVTFDGEGSVTYRNRYVESKGLLAERRHGTALFGGLSQFVMPSPELAEEAGGVLKNTANTNIVRHAGRILALMEAGHPTEMSPSLDTIGEFTWGGKLEGPMTAHPRLDASTGVMCFFGSSPFPPFVRYHEVSPTGDLLRSVDVNVGRSTMMHDFVITQQHAVFFDLPVIFDVNRMLAGQPGFFWDGEAGARVGVLRRDGDSDDVTWIDIDACFVFHFLSAQELPDGRIEVIGCRSPRLNVSFGPDDAAPEATAVPTLHRWVIDPTARRATSEALDDRATDFPRINEARSGQTYRYGYSGHTGQWTDDDVMFDGVIKWDLTAGTDSTFVYGPTHRAGEAAFADDPADPSEDGGWLINYVTDETTWESRMVILDARDITAGPVAEVLLPRRIPFGFHGNWMPGLIP